MVLPEFHDLFELPVEGLLDPEHHVLHHDDLVALSVVAEELEGVVKKVPLFLIEDLLHQLCLVSGLLLLLLLLILVLLLLLFLDCSCHY